MRGDKVKKQSLLHLFWFVAFSWLVLLINQVQAVPQDDASLFLPLLTHNPLLQTPTHSPAYGVVFINSAEARSDAQQLANAQATGVEWDRWPLYWNRIEQSAGQFSWAFQDEAAIADIAAGFQINALLLGTPPFYTTGTPALSELPAAELTFSPIAQGFSRSIAAAPLGLYNPVFTDGTDIPGPGKQINPANVWARYVYTAVNRYKPGGVLAQAQNWAVGVGITHWEMWNEPDLSLFWDGSVADYARLLKVGYMAAKQADAAAQVLFGGLANSDAHLGFYDEVLDLYDTDPLANQYGYFHDILATHNYFYAWRTWYHVFRAKNTQTAHGINHPVWVNESGVPAWDDYPGPTWESTSPYRATMSESADFAIQNAIYATYAGASVLFHFQLYDGCGNQPGGTDFPPHNGELCGLPQYPICAGDAFGLYRNPTDAACFRQHPQPETPRPVLTAYQVLTTYFRDVQPYWRLRPGGTTPTDGPQEWIAFYQPHTGNRIVGMWARFGTVQTAVITATSTSALLVYPDGLTDTITPTNGVYTIPLAAATNLNAPWDPTLYAIGGRPVILIEQDLSGP